MKYFSASDYYKKLFGHKVYKISLDAGCTCPTRDGTKGFGGCIFCSESGSGEFAANRLLSISEQIEQGASLVKNKIKSLEVLNVKEKYIAYFQNFTSTYGDENLLLEKFRQAIYNPEVAGLAIATRPDCLPQSILEKINALSIESKKYLSIEFGLQTCKTSSINYINRRYENSEYVDAINRIKNLNKNIHVVTHLIFGLPGESRDDMINSIKFALEAKTDGLKIQVLNVLRGTLLEKDFLENKFNVLEMEEYFSIVQDALKIIPSEIVIHRLTGDGAKNILVAPLWVANKKKVLSYINSL